MNVASKPSAAWILTDISAMLRAPNVTSMKEKSKPSRSSDQLEVMSSIGYGQEMRLASPQPTLPSAVLVRRSEGRGLSRKFAWASVLEPNRVVQDALST